MKATCKKVTYEKSSFKLVQKVKGGTVDGFQNGKHLKNRGHGWGELTTPSRLVLSVEINNEKHEIWIDRFFKDKLGKLTSRRRTAIAATMPDEVEVEEGQEGKKYYAAKEKDLTAWLKRCQNQL